LVDVSHRHCSHIGICLGVLEGTEMKTVIEMVREAGGVIWSDKSASMHCTELERFAELVRADEREAITEEWSMCVQSDLEHGVSYLNEKATEDWFKNYPQISKFWAWLDARGTHEA